MLNRVKGQRLLSTAAILNVTQTQDTRPVRVVGKSSLKVKKLHQSDKSDQEASPGIHWWRDFKAEVIDYFSDRK